MTCYQFLNQQVAAKRKNSSEETEIYYCWFQTAKDGDQTKNSSTFDHVNLKNAYVTLNLDRYPAVDYNLSFANEKFSRKYGDAASFELNSLVWMN